MLSSARRIGASTSRGNLFRGLSTSDKSLFKYDFDSETEVIKKSDDLAVGHVSNRWSVGDAPNGGLLMALAIKAAAQFSTHPDPLSVSAYFINKAIENETAEMKVRIMGKSRTTTSFHVQLSQQGMVRCEFMGTFGDLKSMKGLTLINKTAPKLPAVEECMNSSKVLRKVFGEKLRIANEIETRVPKDDPHATSALVGKLGEEASLTCYTRFADHRLPCLTSMAFFLDALPPPSVNVTPTSWVPTLEYTVHFWAHPQGDAPWVVGKFDSSVINNGLLYTDGEIWSSDGSVLYATSRQFARILDKR